MSEKKVKKPRNWKKIGLISGAGLVLFVLLFAGSVHYTSKPSFCRTCHYMESFYQSWKESSHSNVTCTDCHYPPGLKYKLRGKMEGLVQVVKYTTHAYRKSKPWAEIPDESCLRSGCHQRQLLEGKGEEEFKGVHFSHKPHLTQLRRGKKLRCTSCHSQIVQGSHMVVTENTCFVCHFKKGEKYEEHSECRLCHTDARMLANSQAGTLRYDHTMVIENKMNCQECHSETISGDGAVLKEQCFVCHFENERLARFNDTDFLHKTHITDHKVECFQCHLPIEHKISHRDIEAVSDCKTCHEHTHVPQKDLLAGIGGKGVESKPNPMFEIGLNCRGCHILHGYSTNELEEVTYKADPQACEKCHGKGFGNLMKQWETITEAKINRLEKWYQTVRTKTRTGDRQTEIDELLAAAEFNIDLVKQGKSVHNVSYADALLNTAYDNMSTALQLAGSTYQLPASFKETSQKVPSDCAACHASLPVNEVNIWGISFSHERHVVKHDLPCQKCHSNMRQHGELILNRKKCLNCHHQEQKEKTCKDCHEEADAFFYGTTTLVADAEPDLMAEVLDCYSCHSGKGGKIVRPSGQTCIDCHDDGYDELLEEWQGNIQTLLSEITTLRKQVNVKALNESQKKQLTRIDQKIAAVDQDGSSGMHNYFLIDSMLTQVKEELQALQPSS
ncbi:MAG: hypothetical protein D6675_04295 [Gemmatimonadetes bacterium]|nr:MAG: hypothetical protein D6675_04295 [Gemmatimonadota bacterium]